MTLELEDSSDRVEFLRERQVQSWQEGKPLFVEELIAGISPELTQDELMELIYAEMFLRAEQGESCNPDEYRRRFPENAEWLERLFEIHEFLANDEPDHSRTLETSMNSLSFTSTRFEASSLGDDSLLTQNDNTADGEMLAGKTLAASWGKGGSELSIWVMTIN